MDTTEKKVPLSNNHLGFPNSSELIVLAVQVPYCLKIQHSKIPSGKTVDSNSEKAL